MVVVILLSANTQGDLVTKLIVITALLAVLLITLLALFGATYIQKILGVWTTCFQSGVRSAYLRHGCPIRI